MARKTVPFTPKGIEKLPNNKPVDYQILTPTEQLNYEGVAQRGRVQGRITEHLPGGKDHVPGSKVRIQQHPSINDARAREARVIARTKPPYNKQGK